MRWLKGQQENDETRPTYLTIHPESRHVSLSGEQVSLDADDEGLRRSAEAIVEYFNNYERGFVGDVPRLQRDYFTFMSWLYFSPFICDLRTRAVVSGGNIFHYPSFAVIYGKSNCGKTSLVDTLITSMFGHPQTVQKDSSLVEPCEAYSRTTNVSQSCSMTSPVDASTSMAWISLRTRTCLQ